MSSVCPSFVSVHVVIFLCHSAIKFLLALFRTDVTDANLLRLFRHIFHLDRCDIFNFALLSRATFLVFDGRPILVYFVSASFNCLLSLFSVKFK